MSENRDSGNFNRTRGSISFDAPGYASGIVSYQGRNYAIEIQSFSPGTYIGASFLDYRGKPEGLAGWSADIDAGLLLGVGISFSFAGGPAVKRANLGIGFDLGVSFTKVTPLDPQTFQGGPSPSTSREPSTTPSHISGGYHPDDGMGGRQQSQFGRPSTSPTGLGRSNGGHHPDDGVGGPDSRPGATSPVTRTPRYSPPDTLGGLPVKNISLPLAKFDVFPAFDPFKPQIYSPLNYTPVAPKPPHVVKKPQPPKPIINLPQNVPVPTPAPRSFWDQVFGSGSSSPSGSDRAANAVRDALSKGASPTQAKAAGYKTAQALGVNTDDAGFSARMDRTAGYPSANGGGQRGAGSTGAGRSGTGSGVGSVNDHHGNYSSSSLGSGGGSRSGGTSSGSGSGKGGSRGSGSGSSGGKGSSSRGGSSSGGGGRGGRRPVLLDLAGHGLQIDGLGSSSRFVDLAGDGYEHRTAWAGDGNGVLVFDADGDGKISRSSEFIFTEWDKSETSDLRALRKVFDTNGNGKLDAGDARWADFKVMVGDRLVSLASLGITSIDLTPKGSGQSFEDGSAITGTTTYTKADGTTGQVGDAVLVGDENGYKIKRTKTVNADGSTTEALLAYNKDGSLAFRNLITTSADGSHKLTKFDDDGNGTFDRSQTVDLIVAGSAAGGPARDGARTRVVANFNADGS